MYVCTIHAIIDPQVATNTSYTTLRTRRRLNPVFATIIVQFPPFPPVPPSSPYSRLFYLHESVDLQAPRLGGVLCMYWTVPSLAGYVINQFTSLCAGSTATAQQQQQHHAWPSASPRRGPPTFGGLVGGRTGKQKKNTPGKPGRRR